MRFTKLWGNSESNRQMPLSTERNALVEASSLLFDLHITLVYQPLPLFPTPVTCTIGVARRLPPFFGTVAQAVRCSIQLPNANPCRTSDDRHVLNGLLRGGDRERVHVSLTFDLQPGALDAKAPCNCISLCDAFNVHVTCRNFAGPCVPR